MDHPLERSYSNQFHPLAAIATTARGAKILQPICQSIGASLWMPESCADCEPALIYSDSLKNHLVSIWHQYRAFVFCLATGAVVRLIAPLLEDKSRDPAVVVVDENGRFVISLSGAHQAGADLLTRAIAATIGATPVITGASAALELPGIDVLGVPFGWQKGDGDWNEASGAIARGERVRVIQEAGSTLWQAHLPSGHPFDFQPETEESLSPKTTIWIGCSKKRFSESCDVALVRWHPRVLWVGIGCERGTFKELIETAIEATFERHDLALEAIAAISTIDLKADEEGLLEFCRDRRFLLKTFSAEQLRRVEVPNPSNIVDKEVGTPSVAEAAALRALGDSDSREALIVPKQIFKQAGMGAVTVAIARSRLEYTARRGSLLLVGIGPGNYEQITPAAKTAISRADAAIGYSLYLDLVGSLFRPGQIIESFPITKELERARRAIELARWGLTVAVISSGDCSIYGMAGLVLEQLQLDGWDGNDPEVLTFPGITAMQAAAAKVGAPLMHDFCAISLSDLLTPWEVIEKRLEAAAIGDFVTAFYNPRSKLRTRQIIIAREIFLKYRDSNTPVAIVRSAYRQDERIVLTTLDEMLEVEIDMLTTVLIGNRSTRSYAKWMITPRGYVTDENSCC